MDERFDNNKDEDIYWNANNSSFQKYSNNQLYSDRGTKISNRLKVAHLVFRKNVMIFC